MKTAGVSQTLVKAADEDGLGLVHHVTRHRGYASSIMTLMDWGA